MRCIGGPLSGALWAWTAIVQLLQSNAVSAHAVTRHRVSHRACASACFRRELVMTSPRGRKWRRKSASDVIVHAMSLLVHLRTLTTALSDPPEAEPLPAELTGKVSCRWDCFTCRVNYLVPRWHRAFFIARPEIFWTGADYVPAMMIDEAERWNRRRSQLLEKEAILLASRRSWRPMLRGRGQNFGQSGLEAPLKSLLRTSRSRHTVRYDMVYLRALKNWRKSHSLI